jgi:SAM-dependent methyltransferase
MDSTTRANRSAWETAAHKYVDEYDEHLAQAATGSELVDVERDLLREVLSRSPAVVHPQSGHGLDDIALVRAGARSVVGVDYSTVPDGAAQRRADELGAPCRYVVAAVPGIPLASASADLVYTGKGALIWMPDLAAWARDVARVLRPSGHLFVYEAHPAVPLWTWDEDEPRIRTDRGYFDRRHLGQIVTTVIAAGMRVLHLSEHPEPFWRAGGVAAAAWGGRLPNSFALLARKD